MKKLLLVIFFSIISFSVAILIYYHYAISDNITPLDENYGNERKREELLFYILPFMKPQIEYELFLERTKEIRFLLKEESPTIVNFYQKDWLNSRKKIVYAELNEDKKLQFIKTSVSISEDIIEGYDKGTIAPNLFSKTLDDRQKWVNLYINDKSKMFNKEYHEKQHSLFLKYKKGEMSFNDFKKQSIALSHELETIIQKVNKEIKPK
jgi:hypothetical protein